MNSAKKNSKRTEFTRLCIAEAVIALLKEQKLEQIRISNVVIKAGVSRMTFYNNYHSIEDVLKDYIHIIVDHYVQTHDKKNHNSTEYKNILNALIFFDGYRSFFKIMRDRGLQGLILDSMNDYIASVELDSEKKYQMYFYSGGLLNVFLEWENKCERKPAEEIAVLISNSLRGAQE